MTRVTVLLEESLAAWLEDNCRKASSKKSTYIASLIREEMLIAKEVTAIGVIPPAELASKTKEIQLKFKPRGPGLTTSTAAEAYDQLIKENQIPASEPRRSPIDWDAVEEFKSDATTKPPTKIVQRKP